MVALANPEHEADLLQLGRFLATGAEAGGKAMGIHLEQVPFQTPLSVARERFTSPPAFQRSIDALLAADEAPGGGGDDEGPSARAAARRPVASTEVQALTNVAHDVFGTLIREVTAQRADLLLMGWQGGLSLSRIYSTPVQRILTELPADVAVLKDRGIDPVQRILVPWGGGMHALLGLELAARVAGATGATMEVLRVVRPGRNPDRERTALEVAVGDVVGEDDELVRIRIEEAGSVVEGLQAVLGRAEHDLVIIGASEEWRIRNVLFGSVPDLVADSAPCSVLMVRRFLPEHWAIRAASGVKRLKEAAGISSSPQEGAR
jgi:nucleotide-binding universal stress UspA family protein